MSTSVTAPDSNHPFASPEIRMALPLDSKMLFSTTTFPGVEIKTPRARQFTFTFDGCRNIEIKDNSFSEDVLGKNVLLKNTNRTDLKEDLDFEIEEL